MTAPWILIAALAAVGLVYVLLPVGLEVFFRFRAARRLRCPETGADAEVGVDAGRAAFTALLGRPHLRIERCSLWPERMGCGQACLSHFEEKPPDALHTESS